MNVFKNSKIASEYDAYYQTEFGKKIDEIEKALISKLIEEIPRAEMIELGCGTGHWTALFEKSGFNVTATDTSAAMLKFARQKKLNADFILADSESLPFPDESTDFLATITMLEFVNDRQKVLNEIYRVLKPGGWFLAGCLNAKSVLAKNSTNDEVFKNADFMTENELREAFQIFGKPEIQTGVFLTPDFQIQDETAETLKAEPVFMTALVQKNKIK